MNQRQTPKRGKRGATVAAVLCFVAAIAIVGTYTFGDYRDSQRGKEAQTEDAENEKQQSEEAATDLVINEAEDADDDASDTPDSTGEGTDAGADASQGAAGGRDGNSSAGSEKSQAAAGKSTAVKFTSDSQLLWPVNGTLIMTYSMDKTVYFSTLDQYKYNPALIISGAEGDQVLSSAPGVVKSIDTTAQTGTTVNVDLGNGYELLYGQLKEVAVKTGDHVSAKTVLGYVSKPTKYYSVEGPNVYFEMRKDGQPINPMEYLAEE